MIYVCAKTHKNPQYGKLFLAAETFCTISWCLAQAIK